MSKTNSIADSLKERINNLSDSKLSADCTRLLENSKNGTCIINFRYTLLEVVELYEVMDILSLPKSQVIKGSISKYKKAILPR